MKSLYGHLLKSSGDSCYTLSQDIPARMEANLWRVKITYQPGKERIIPRETVEKAIGRLVRQKRLDKQKVGELPLEI